MIPERHILLYANHTQELKLKVVKGFRTVSDAMKSVNVMDTWEPGSNEKVYFFKGCTVPRFKVRKKFKCTNTAAYATTMFVSKESFEDFEEDVHSFKKNIEISKDVATDLIERSNVSDNLMKTFESLIKMPYDSISLMGSFVDIHLRNTLLFSNGHTLEQYFDSGLIIPGKNIKSWSITNRWEMETNTLYFVKPNSDLAQAGKSGKLFIETAMLKHVNEDMITIDEQKYEELRLYGNAGDDENVGIMLEIMSNVNFEESIVYLLALIQEFHGKILKHKYRQHVNFKSLLTYLDIKLMVDRSKRKVYLNDAGYSLKGKGLFTAENANLLVRLYHDKGLLPAGGDFSRSNDDRPNLFMQGVLPITNQLC